LFRSGPEPAIVPHPGVRRTASTHPQQGLKRARQGLAAQDLLPGDRRQAGLRLHLGPRRCAGVPCQPGFFVRLHREAPAPPDLRGQRPRRAEEARCPGVPFPASGRWAQRIVQRADTAKGAGVLPRHWGVARGFARLARSRRSAGDRERTVASAKGWRRVAHLRRLTRLTAGA
jgi:hypothetical protein